MYLAVLVIVVGTVDQTGYGVVMRLQAVMMLALAVGAGPVAARQAMPASPAPAPAQLSGPAPEKKICRSILSTGSILPGKRICHTRSEWATIDGINGQDVETIRNRTIQNGNPSIGN